MRDISLYGCWEANVRNGWKADPRDLQSGTLPFQNYAHRVAPVVVPQGNTTFGRVDRHYSLRSCRRFFLARDENRKLVVDDESSGSGAERPPADEALTHLQRALAVIESSELPLVIGARIQHAIDTLLPWISRRTENFH